MQEWLNNQKIQHIIIGGILILSVLFSIVDNIVPIPQNWKWAVIFLSTLAIFWLVIPIGRLIGKVQDLEDKIQSIVDSQCSIQCRNYSDSNEFYSDLYLNIQIQSMLKIISKNEQIAPAQNVELLKSSEKRVSESMRPS